MNAATALTLAAAAYLSLTLAAQLAHARWGARKAR